MPVVSSLKSLPAIALCVALCPVDCAATFWFDGAACEWTPSLAMLLLFAVSRCRPTTESSAPTGDAIEPIAWIPAVCVALWALLNDQWRVFSAHDFMFSWPALFAGAVLCAGLLLTLPIVALARRFTDRHTLARSSPSLRRASLALAAVAAALSLAASIARAQRPSTDAVFFAPVVADLSNPAAGVIHSLPDDRALVLDATTERDPLRETTHHRTRLSLRHPQTGHDRLLIEARSVVSGGAIRFEPRARAVSLRSRLQGSRVLFLDAPDTVYHRAWDARHRLAPSLPWIAMGWASVALAIYATRRCHFRKTSPTLGSTYRDATPHDHSEANDPLASATALWALASALLFLTPLAFALCSGMITGS